MRVLFILPGEGGGGGSHSVVQESHGLIRLGVEVAIANTTDTIEAFRWHYPELEGGAIALHPLAGYGDIIPLLDQYDLVVATTAPSANALARALKEKPKRQAKVAYYIQDYEPLFRMPGTQQWDEARASYSALPGALMFAKTDFLKRIVHDNHGHVVERVKASIDHAVYRPALHDRSGDVLTISAMVRPKTPRRGPLRTVRALETIAATYRGRVKVIAFGAEPADYDRIGVRLSDEVEDRGMLRRSDVAELLRVSDLFLDLSDYQAFGRTGLEAMACGCTPMLPVFGGADEYARHWENAILVDPRSDEMVMDGVDAFIEAGPQARGRLRANGIAKALDYTIEKAAFSEYQLFAKFLDRA
jgi:glycosyltransferase involved in cell wall biosynthesis